MTAYASDWFVATFLRDVVVFVRRLQTAIERNITSSVENGLFWSHGIHHPEVFRRHPSTNYTDTPFSGTFWPRRASYVRNFIPLREQHANMESLIQDLKQSFRMFVH